MKEIEGRKHVSLNWTQFQWEPPEKPSRMYLRLATSDIHPLVVPHGSQALPPVLHSFIVPLFGMYQLVPQIVPLSGGRESHR